MTVEALKHYSMLQPLLERTQLVEQGRGLTQAVALVLAYELLWGEGLRPVGPAERAVLQRKVSRAGGAAPELPCTAACGQHCTVACTHILFVAVVGWLCWSGVQKEPPVSLITLLLPPSLHRPTWPQRCSSCCPRLGCSLRQSCCLIQGP